MPLKISIFLTLPLYWLSTTKYQPLLYWPSTHHVQLSQLDLVIPSLRLFKCMMALFKTSLEVSCHQFSFQCGFCPSNHSREDNRAGTTHEATLSMFRRHLSLSLKMALWHIFQRQFWIYIVQTAGPAFLFLIFQRFILVCVFPWVGVCSSHRICKSGSKNPLHRYYCWMICIWKISWSR